MVPISLRLDRGSSLVPKQTRWCVVLEETYPRGAIKVFPAASGGLTSTFPHQDRNSLKPGHLGWRSGKLCLDSPLGRERGIVLIRDPWGEADLRIRWHIERALLWLEAAANEELLATGDPFEIPMQASTSITVDPARVVIHDETHESFDAWEGRVGTHGVVEFHALESFPGILFANFHDQSGVPINLWKGRGGSKVTPEVLGIWWLWPRPIVVRPWHAPGNWGELRLAGLETGVNVERLLAQLAPVLRERTNPTIMMLGYPIPTRVGETPSEVHWNALLMPRLLEATPKSQRQGQRKLNRGMKSQRAPKGFRKNSRGWWHRDYTSRFWDGADLRMIRTENWSGERLQARGRLPASVLNSKIAVIGVGALGSFLSELLVRAGIREITLIDADSVSAGNACRHVLTIADVYKNKVDALAARLEQISPLVKVNKYPIRLPERPEGLMELLEHHEIIVDCTASDDLPKLLASVWSPVPRLFVSFSLGYGGRRMFSFGEYGHTFSEGSFNQKMVPWLEAEASSWGASGEVLEGAGCWSPLFPARVDDVTLAGSFCLKELVRFAIERPRSAQFRVFSQKGPGEGMTDSFELELLEKVDET